MVDLNINITDTDPAYYKTGVKIVGLSGVVPVTYLLQVTWDSAGDQGYTDAQVLDIDAEGVEDGSGVVTETDGTLAVVSNKLKATAQATPTWGDLGIVWTPTSDADAGKGLLTVLNTSDYTKPVAFGFTDNGLAVANLMNAVIIQTDKKVDVYENGIVTGTDLVTLTDNTDEKFFIVLGGADSSAVPWDDDDAIAGFDYGAHIYQYDSSNWVLIWKSYVIQDSAQTKPAHTFYTFGGTVDDVKITNVDLSTVLQPTAKSTFDAANDTSLDAITPEVGSGWTEQDVNFSITSNKAVYTGTAQDGVAYVETSEADILTDITVDTTVVDSRKGLCIRRSIDGGVGANRWEVYCISGVGIVTTTSYIVENNNGGRIARASDTGLSIAYPNDLRCITDGDVIDLFINGNNKLSYVSAAFNSTATEHGIFIRDNAGVAANGSYDNFAVYPRTSTTYDDEFDAV